MVLVLTIFLQIKFENIAHSGVISDQGAAHSPIFSLTNVILVQYYKQKKSKLNILVFLNQILINFLTHS